MDIDVPAGADAPAPAAASARPLPSHIILEADHAGWRAGHVLAADADLLAMLDSEHVPYREASPAERALGGFA